MRTAKESPWNTRKKSESDIENGWYRVDDQDMYWHNGQPSGFWYAELWLRPKELWEEPLKEIKQMPFTSETLLDWIDSYWIEAQHSVKIQVPKHYGLRIQAHYNHYSMVFNWKHKVKLSKRLTSDCVFYDSNNIKRVIAAKDMFIISLYRKSEKQKCVDECRLKHLPTPRILRGDI